MKFLFDLGGIFFNWDPVHFYKDIFSSKEEMNYFLNKICNDDWNLQQDSGRTIKEAESELISYHPKYKEEIKMYYLNHRKMIKNTYKESDHKYNLDGLILTPTGSIPEECIDKIVDVNKYDIKLNYSITPNKIYNF